MRGNANGLKRYDIEPTDGRGMLKDGREIGRMEKRFSEKMSGDWVSGPGHAVAKRKVGQRGQVKKLKLF